MTTTTVAGYTRISRVGKRKGEGFISEKHQREGILYRAEQLGLNVGEWFHDPDRSGGNMQRPEWERLMARVEDPADPIQGVIVVRVDRFARTVPEGAPEVGRIWKAGGVFVAADLPLDTTTPQGRNMLWSWLSNAEMFLELNKAGWWRAKTDAMERGAHLGRTPLGYGRVPRHETLNGLAAGRLYPLPEWQPVIVGIFEYAAANPYLNEGAIATWANEHAPRPDGKRWVHPVIARLLKSRTYLGESHYGPKDGKSFKALENSSAHEPMVDELLWARAQRTRKRSVYNATSGAAMLQGLVRCQACRHTMVPTHGGNKVPVYRCNGTSSAGKCPAPSSISRRVLDAYVKDWITAHAPEIDRRLRATETTDFSEVDRLDALYQEAKEIRERIAKNSTQAAMYPEEWEMAVKDARANEDEARAAWEIAVQATPSVPVLSTEITRDNLTDAEWSKLLRDSLDCVVVRRGRHDRVKVLCLGEADADLSGQGRPATEIRPFDCFD